jgi:haloacetate dehalogenase
VTRDHCAAAGIDLTHDEEDHRAGRKIAAPTLVMWGSRSHTGKFYDGNQLAIWREAASNVTGGPLDNGHYLAEEAPQAVLEAFERFFV